MPIKTENAGSLIGGSRADKTTRKVTFIKQTYVHSLGRNSAVGETQDVSDADARFLIAYRYAKKAVVEAVDVPEVEEVEEAPETTEETAEEAEVESTTEVETAEEPQRYFGRGRGRRRGGE